MIRKFVYQNSVITEEQFKIVPKFVAQPEKDRMVRVRLGEKLLEDSETESRKGVFRALEENPFCEFHEGVDFALKKNKITLSKIIYLITYPAKFDTRQ
jgi:hypothetical protein